MMTSDDKVGGWVKKGQNHDDVILECPLSMICSRVKHICKASFFFALSAGVHVTNVF